MGTIAHAQGQNSARRDTRLLVTAADSSGGVPNRKAIVVGLTSHANYTGCIGTQTSPFSGQPTAVNNMRKVEFLVNFQF
jgi:hypothetical protein